MSTSQTYELADRIEIVAIVAAPAVILAVIATIAIVLFERHTKRDGRGLTRREARRIEKNTTFRRYDLEGDDS